MIKFRFFLVLLILSFFGIVSISASLPNRVVINKITINGRVISPQERQNIIIAETDTIIFYYYCKTEKKDIPFLFKINISNSLANSNMQSTNHRIVKYFNLPEEDYKIKISAFSSAEGWNSVPAKLSFRVNNREAKLMRTIYSLQEKIESIKSIKPKKKENKSSFDFTLVIFSFIIGILFATFVLIIVNIMLKKNKHTKIKETKKDLGAKMDEKLNFTEEDFEKIVAENGNLKAELAALRGQVDALQSRSEDLRTQNKELKNKLETLSKSKEEVEELSKQKEELFAIVIHDIKNPVTLIKSLVELLRSYDLTAKEQSEIIDDIFVTTNKIVSLSQEISKVLALESTHIKVNYEKVNLNYIINDVVNRYQHKALEKNILIDFHENNDLPECDIDVNKIDDVVDNLLSNAIKYSYPNTKVKITLKKIENYLEVNVSDNGQGLSEDDIKQAFKRGALLSARPTGKEHSSGLGLWIVKKLISLHNGKVWIKSAVGKGSTFSFSIPISRKEE